MMKPDGVIDFGQFATTDDGGRFMSRGELATLRQQNALLTLEVQRLREALEKVKEHAEFESDASPLEYVEHAAVRKGQLISIEEIVAEAIHPLDTSALDKYVAEKVEPWKKDAERLDFVLEFNAFIEWSTTDAQIKVCQLVTQDEDENYVRLHAHTRFFADTRQAIDAAIAAQEGK
jgi:hypothetical protein